MNRMLLGASIRSLKPLAALSMSRGYSVSIRGPMAPFTPAFHKTFSNTRISSMFQTPSHFRSYTTGPDRKSQDIGDSGTVGSSVRNTPQSAVNPPLDAKIHPILRLVPRFLHGYASRFINAPVSHVTAFLVLHELSAIVPLFGLWAVFHHFHYIPVGIPEWLIVKGTSFIDTLAENNDWKWIKAEDSARIVMEGAAAYAIVKVLLPFRAFLSLVLMPWFAKWFVIPTTRLLGNIFSRKKSVDKSKVWNQQLEDASKLKIKDKSSENGPTL